jgi:hypothetical protein
MSSTLTLLLVDKATFQVFYQETYSSRVAFRQAFNDALDVYEDTIFDDSIQIIEHPAHEPKASIIAQFLTGLFDGHESIGIDQDGIASISAYLPHVISEDDVAMIQALLTDYGFDAYNASRYPETPLAVFLDWLKRNIGKPVYLV